MSEYIEREAFLDAIERMKPYHQDADDIAEMLQNFPAADVRPAKRGKWIDRDDDYYGWNMWSCSACGEEFVLTEGTPDMNDYHFCPNCGADMREES